MLRVGIFDGLSRKLQPRNLASRLFQGSNEIYTFEMYNRRLELKWIYFKYM